MLIICRVTGFVKRGRYVSEWKQVAVEYAKRGLLVDVLAGVPISWVDYLVMPNLTCAEQSEVEEQVCVCVYVYLRVCK